MVLRRGGGVGGRPGDDAADRQSSSEASHLREPQDSHRTRRQPPSGTATDATHGDRGDLPTAADQQVDAGTRDLPFFIAESGSVEA